VRISIATSLAEVQGLRPLWTRLQERSGASIFQHFDWNLLALQTFPEEKPYFVAVEAGSSAAIIPAVMRNDEIRLSGGPLFDYRDAICVGDDTASTLAMEMADELGLPWNVFGLTSSARWGITQSWSAAPHVSLRDISAEAFTEQHARARRSLRRLADLGARVRALPGTAELIQRIYCAKAKEPSAWGQNVFRDPRCIEFMRNAVTFPQTRCEIFLMEDASDPIAALVTFIDGRIRRFYTTWMNERWAKHSPGIALLYEATCQTLAAGLDCDYMTGEQPYKLRFATGSAPLYKLQGTASDPSRSAHELETPKVA